jgi:hypothetical protein
MATKALAALQIILVAGLAALVGAAPPVPQGTEIRVNKALVESAGTYFAYFGAVLGGSVVLLEILCRWLRPGRRPHHTTSLPHLIPDPLHAFQVFSGTLQIDQSLLP